jgi:ribonucleoside-diphosphate reductase alpha chain
MDMKVMDPAWIGMKLRKLLNYAEPKGDFMAWVHGSKKQQSWPSTVAYIARLVIHRYQMLGILDNAGEAFGVAKNQAVNTEINPPVYVTGKKCPECHTNSYIRKDGCDFCTHCGHVGACG